MRFAYADPPYFGTSQFGAAHHYSAYHADAADYDGLDAHEALVQRLVDEFPDGWALSLQDELVDLFPGSGVMDRVLAQGRLA